MARILQNPATRRQRGEHRAPPALMVAIALAPVVLIAGRADSSADDRTAASVQRLVRQLDAGSLAQRAAAERELLQMGPEVLPYLHVVETDRSPAIRDAVRRIQESLERRLAGESVLPGRVTLSGTHTLRTVLDQIERQTGNAVHIGPGGDELLRLERRCEWEKATFWECIEWIDQQDGVAARHDPDTGRLEIVDQSVVTDRPIRTALYGAFRVSVWRVTLRPDFTDRGRNVIRVRYEVAAEPRLRPLFVRISDSDFALMTSYEAANRTPTSSPVAAPLTPGARRERPAGKSGPVALSADFAVTENWRGEMVSLTGRLEIELAAGHEEFVFRNLAGAGNVVRRRGGVTVTLEKVESLGAASSDLTDILVELRVVYDQGGPAFESHRTWVYHNEASLQSSEGGKRWTYSAFETVAGAEAAVRLKYRFEDVPPPEDDVQFVYAAPTLIITWPLMLELTDLPVRAEVEETR